MFWGCITGDGNSTLGKRKRPESCGSPSKRMKYEQEDNGTDDEDEDGIREFRRVQIIQREFSSPTVQLPSPDGTTRICSKNIIHTVYSNVAKEITEELEPDMGWRTGMSSPCSQSTPLSPGWAPLSEYSKTPSPDGLIPDMTSDSFATYLPPLPPPRFVPVNGPAARHNEYFERKRRE